MIAPLTVGSELNNFATRMHAVAEATAHPAQGRLETNDMRVIRQVAAQSTSKRERWLMKAILAAVKQGPQGIISANQTATFLVNLAFHRTYDDSFTVRKYQMNKYIEKLEGIRQRNSVVK